MWREGKLSGFWDAFRLVERNVMVVQMRGPSSSPALTSEINVCQRSVYQALWKLWYLKQHFCNRGSCVCMWGGQLWLFIRYSQEFPSVFPLPLSTGRFRGAECRQVSLWQCWVAGNEIASGQVNRRGSLSEMGIVELVLITSQFPDSSSWWTVPLGPNSWMDNMQLFLSGITVLGTKILKRVQGAKCESCGGSLWRDVKEFWQPLQHCVQRGQRTDLWGKLECSYPAGYSYSAPCWICLRKFPYSNWSFFLPLSIIWAHLRDASLLNWPDDYPLINLKVSWVWFVYYQERDLLGSFLGQLGGFNQQ